MPEFIAMPLVVIAVIAVLIVVMGGKKKKPKPSNALHISPASFGPGLPDKHVIADSGRGDVGGDCMHTLDCIITFPGPLPTGEWHAGIMQRASLEGIESGQFNGVGTIFGTLWQGVVPPYGMASMTNQAAVEVWQIGQKPENFQHVKPETLSFVFEPGVPYRFQGWSRFKGDKRTYQFSFGDYTSPAITHDLAVGANNNALAFFSIGGAARIEAISSTWTQL